jgi:hypothetical protein
MEQVPVLKAWAEDTANKTAPTQTDIGTGIVYSSETKSNEVNGALFLVFEALRFLQRAGGMYSATIPYTYPMSCFLIHTDTVMMTTKIENFIRLSANPSDTTGFPPITGATVTDVSGIKVYSGGSYDATRWSRADDANTLSRVTPGSGGLAALAKSATIWASDNDGSGSGLDSDLWDGLDRPSGFAELGDGGIPSYSSDVVTTLTKVGQCGLFSGAVNIPALGYIWHITVIGGGISSNQTRYLAFALDSFLVYVGRKTSSTNIAWDKLWGASTDGSGSGMDTDYVRGIAILNTLSAQATNVGDPTKTTTVYFSKDALWLCTNCIFDGINFFRINEIYGASAIVITPLGVLTRKQVTAGTGAITWSSYTIWDSGTDGTGSGLDSDLWDGLDRPSGFAELGDGGIPSYSSDVVTTLTKVGQCGLFSGAVNIPALGYIWHITVIGGGSASNQTRYLAFALDSSLIYSGRKTSSSVIAWDKMWSAGSDGVGSGMDTDFFRGVGIGSFLSDKGFITTDDYNVTFTEGIYGVSKDGTVLSMLMVFGSVLGGGTSTVQLEFAAPGVGSLYGTAFPRWRNCTNSATWSPWHILWGTDTDGVGSGLDAGLLCGVDPRVGTAGTYGTLTSTSGASLLIPAGEYVFATPNASGGSGTQRVLLLVWDGSEWRTGDNGIQSFAGGYVKSDGVNFMFGFSNATKDTTFYYRKIY